MALRIATFNAENIMQRFDFSGFRDALLRDRTLGGLEITDREQFKLLEQARVVAHADDKMQLTALAISDTKADIICLQEVENMEALDAFEDGYLHRMTGRGYPHRFLVEGNDGRGIDVAVMMREETTDGDEIEFVEMRSHADRTYNDLDLFNEDLAKIDERPDEKVFRRDCLEIDLRIGGRPITLFVVHFKSMGTDRDGVDGRQWTMPVRTAEARAVRRIIEDRFGERAGRMRWMICGDFNDYRERIVVEGSKDSGYSFTPILEEKSGFDPLLADGFSVDLAQRLDQIDRWTLFYSKGLDYQHLCQLDYLLASPTFAEKNPLSIPDIIRNGQPWRTPFPPGQEPQRYPRIGWDRPKSSDHCPLAVTLNIV